MLSYMCPRCKAVSYNPHDLAYGYCGRCGDFKEVAALKARTEAEQALRKAAAGTGTLPPFRLPSLLQQPWSPVPKPEKRERKTKHTEWVGGLACCICGQRQTHGGGVVHAHHVRTFGAGGSEKDTVPLCAHHHTLFHSMGRETFQQAYSIDLQGLADALWEEGPFGADYHPEEAELLDEIDYLTEDPPPPGGDDGSLVSESSQPHG